MGLGRDLLNLAKKLFKFYKQTQSQNQQQSGYGGGSQHHSNYQNQNSNPYPQQQQHHAASGSNAHDDPYYTNLRNQARSEGDLMHKCFEQSKQQFSAGNRARAKDLSSEGKEHQQKMNQFNYQAASWIFTENNKKQPNGTIDLHGLFVQESIDFTEGAIDSARNQGLAELRVIVGKGNHSVDHVAKIKPAISSMMKKKNLSANLDPRNSGVLVVHLQGQGGGSRDIAGDIENNPDTCIVM